MSYLLKVAIAAMDPNAVYHKEQKEDLLRIKDMYESLESRQKAISDFRDKKHKFHSIYTSTPELDAHFEKAIRSYWSLRQNLLKAYNITEAMDPKVYA